MGREWREAARRDGSNDGLGAAVMIFWAALVALSLISAVVLSCADGASKDKASATNTDAYGGGCTAGCVSTSGNPAFITISSHALLLFRRIP
ncbi:hypothetical protein RJ639_036376 [Escallonia herrerae]|uniref:Uncharacterized protein n=1 Tax=Escallonia herrerae TaxID=1293975 RepID=A0AA89BC12_9ASTE|nr:hypothetical protein RJ639_036376 [Escallonia herrerae]